MLKLLSCKQESVTTGAQTTLSCCQEVANPEKHIRNATVQVQDQARAYRYPLEEKSTRGEQLPAMQLTDHGWTQPPDMLPEQPVMNLELTLGRTWSCLCHLTGLTPFLAFLCREAKLPADLELQLPSHKK